MKKNCQKQKYPHEPIFLVILRWLDLKHKELLSELCKTTKHFLIITREGLIEALSILIAQQGCIS